MAVRRRRNNWATTETVGQQCGDDRGIDLAYAGGGENHVVAFDGAGVEMGVRSLFAGVVGGGLV